MLSTNEASSFARMSRNVISFNYTLKDKTGEIIDQSQPDQPLTFLEGSNTIIQGLENGLASLKEGDTDEIVVRPENGYGFRDESQIDVVSRSQLPVDDISVGDFFQAGSDAHSPVVKVVKVDGDQITLDANHPLAGVDLFFSVEIVGKREATEEELNHGQAHSAGGCCGGQNGGGCGCH